MPHEDDQWMREASTLLAREFVVLDETQVHDLASMLHRIQSLRAMTPDHAVASWLELFRDPGRQ